jgi:hypothetical protein
MARPYALLAGGVTSGFGLAGIRREKALAWGQSAGAATFSRSISTIIPGAMESTLGKAAGRMAPTQGLAGSTIGCLVFTIGQTLPPFPASIVRQMGTHYSVSALGPFLLD